MRNEITLKNWCEGRTPERNDLVGWSNLIFQRSLQTNDPLNDKVSKYFVSQWTLCDKDSSLLAALFERTFSNYPLSGQISLAEQLMERGDLDGVALLSEVRHHGELQKHLLKKSAIWEALPLHMFRDYLHTAFNDIISHLRGQKEDHAAWGSIERIEEPDARFKVFRELIGPRLLSSFGFLNDGKSYFETELFHAFLSKLSDTWQVHPANFVYALLCLDPSITRDYERYAQFIGPYASDIQALIQWSDLPRDTRLRSKLPPSSTVSTIDGIMALALSSGSGLSSLFKDPKQMVIPVEHDEDIAQALGQALG